jgi:cytochrome oxidase Cu insertion factor (SCO1/SenC/PrrC family)
MVVIAAGRTATSLTSSELRLHEAAGSWVDAGSVSGAVPAAPEQRQLLELAMPLGPYDGVALGGHTERVPFSVASGQVEPLLLGIESGHLAAGAAYAGNDDVNLGLGELSGQFVALTEFRLSDQHGYPIDLHALAGKDVVIAAFHTTCHQTCPLYTALFLQLAKKLPASALLLEVTTDPSTDTPAVLSNYARQVGAGWTFGTGTPQQVADFWKPFDVEIATGDAHTSTLVLVDRHGYVRLVYRGVPKVGGDVPQSLISTLSTQGLHELGSGGDGWGAPDVLQALFTIGGAEQTEQQAGGMAAAFRLTASDGSTVTLAQFAGHPLVINFWASYCPPCRAEMPLLDRSVSPTSGARLLLVDEGDSTASTQAFLDGLGIHRSALLDSDLSVGHMYGIYTLPETIFVRADGTIDRRQVGQLDESVLEAELSNLA